MRRSKDTKLTPVGPILFDVLKEIDNAMEARRARIAAILDAQARQDPARRSIETMKQNEMIEDVFGPEEEDEWLKLR